MFGSDCAKTFKYGPPPDPNKPRPHYPGLPSATFTASSATTAYRTMIQKENDARATFQKQMYGLPPVCSSSTLADRVGGTLPGLMSINKVYTMIGWTNDPTTGRRLAPDPSASEQRYNSAMAETGFSTGSSNFSNFRRTTGSQSGNAWITPQPQISDMQLPALASHCDASAAPPTWGLITTEASNAEAGGAMVQVRSQGAVAPARAGSMGSLRKAPQRGALEVARGSQGEGPTPKASCRSISLVELRKAPQRSALEVAEESQVEGPAPKAPGYLPWVQREERRHVAKLAQRHLRVVGYTVQ